MIRFRNVTKEYPRTGLALHNVTFQVSKGEFVFLTGPSGAGKSTILKLIYLEERPTSGDVKVSGVSASTIRGSKVARLRRKLGVIFQDFRLLEDRTVESNVAFALEVTGAPRSLINPRVSRLLSQVGLASKATAMPRELSGGEQQRVAIARALANDPVVLVADEPTGNLDTVTGLEILKLFARMHRERNLTILLVTHSSEIAEQAQRLIRLRDGRV